MVIHGTATDTAADVNLGRDVGKVAVLNRSTAETIFVNVDGDDAEAATDGNYTVPPGARRTIDVATDGATVLSIIATGSAAWEIEA